MFASIDIWRRNAKQRAHSWTHLLHLALQKYFPETKQEWSFVWEDEIRFDFAASSLLHNEQLQEIVARMNQKIYESLPIKVASMAYSDAVSLWAKAFFADTYGDEVRVVSIGEDTHVISRELCWWNHVVSTDMIGAFCLVSHETVASGTKRIVAYTGPKVLEKLQEQEQQLYTISEQVSVKDRKSVV